MNPTPNTPAPPHTDALTTLLGGTNLQVTKLDGTTETVKVRQLSIRDLPRYGGALQDPARCIELFTSRPPEWVDSLTPDSAIAILEAGHKLNLDFFARVQAQNTKALEKIVPGFGEATAKLLSSVLNNSAPGSPSKPA